MTVDDVVDVTVDPANKDFHWQSPILYITLRKYIAFVLLEWYSCSKAFITGQAKLLTLSTKCMSRQ